jgi:uncharacterized protein (TIGR03435 family)
VVVGQGRMLLFITVTACFSTILATGQSPAQDHDVAARLPTFSVAAIKINKSGDRSVTFEIDHNRLTIRNYPIIGIAMRAYNVFDRQIILRTRNSADRYDIDAIADRAATRPEIMQMLRNLLTDRFKLGVQVERREVDGYALTLDPSGLKIREHLGQSGDCLTQRGPKGEFIIQNCAMDFFASGTLTDIMVDKFVTDKTGLHGTYDFSLYASWELPAGLNHEPRVINPGAPSIIAAVKQQLGLRLDRQKIGVDFLVIDHIEAPTEN